jgi:hypothetical protein
MMLSNPESRSLYAAQLIYLANLSAPVNVSEQGKVLVWMRKLAYSLVNQALTKDDLYAMLEMIDQDMKPFVQSVIDGTHEAAFEGLMARAPKPARAGEAVTRSPHLPSKDFIDQQPSSSSSSPRPGAQIVSIPHTHSFHSGLDRMGFGSEAEQSDVNQFVFGPEPVKRNTKIEDKTLMELVTTCTLKANAHKIIFAARKYIEAHPGIVIPTEYLQSFLQAFWNATQREIEYPGVYTADPHALFVIGLAELIVNGGINEAQLKDCFKYLVPPALQECIVLILVSGWQSVLENLIQSGKCSEGIVIDVAPRMVELQHLTSPAEPVLPLISSE